MVGICGLGGIGKTTLAKAIYNRIFQQFDSSCFLTGVRSKVEEVDLVKLQEKLLHQIIKTKDFEVFSVAEGVNLIKARLRSQKVLIVLDDVDHRNQLESLTRERSWFGSGSVIIITTRDEHLLYGLTTSEIYQAKLLNGIEAQQLFSRHAFNSSFPPQEYVELAQGVIKYSRGLPLALVILGSHLQGRSVEAWRYEFKKLRAIPHYEIQKILKISFDGLDDETQKSVFLDIACAFHGYHEDEVTKTLNACGFHPESAISTLVQRNLLQRDWRRLVMHDLVRDMGREIIHMESRDHISGDVELLSKELRWLSWKGCPLKCIPSNFPAENLVFLNMKGSNIQEFGLNLQYCRNLKKLDLSDCKRLRRTPNFNGSPSLETLWLSNCSSLKEIHQSIGNLDRLIRLSLYRCKKIADLPSSICQLKSLECLDIGFCSSLKTLPVDIGDMQSLRFLHAIHTGIKQLPGSVKMLRNLGILEVGGRNLKANRSFSRRRVQSIESLSVSISVLNLSYCGFSEADIPKDIGSLSSLRSLNLCGSSFHRLPFDFSKFRFLKKLCLNDCENLQTLPSVSTLKDLTDLQLTNCQKLVQITGLDNHPSIENIRMGNCTSLQNPFNEGFFSAHALMKRNLRIDVQCSEIPDWCNNKVTAPSICFTVPTHNKGYKFLGMILWFVFDFKGLSSTLGHFSIAVSDRERVSHSRTTCTDMQVHGEVSCVFYMFKSTSPFDPFVGEINGGEKITVKDASDDGTVKKIGIHLLYLDQHGNVTSLPAKKEKEKKRKRRIIFGGSRGVFLFPVSRKTSARNKRAKL